MDVQTVGKKLLSRRAALRLAGGGAAAAGAVAIVMPKPGQIAAQSSPSIVGAWRTSVKRPDGSVTAGLLLFTSDGTVIRIGTTHPTASPNVGVWSQTGNNTYVWTYWSFSFDSSGKYIGSQKISAQATVGADGNSYSGTFSADTLDIDGTVTLTAPGGTAQASRLHVEPMST